MKKILLSLSLLVFAGAVGLNAQSDASPSKACCKKSTAMVDAKADKAAADLAESDASIEKRVCEGSGKVSYVRKVAATTADAEAQFVPVTYNAETGKFEDKEKKAECADKDASKSCCAKKAAMAAPTAPEGSDSQKAKPTKDTRAN